MAGYEKVEKGWKARIHKVVKGEKVRKSKVFDTKAAAVAWATQFENELASGTNGKVKAATFGRLLDEYLAKEAVHLADKGVLAKKKIEAFKRDFPALANTQLEDLDTIDFVNWKNTRLEQVAPGTVRREWNIFNPAINFGIKKLKWMFKNPLVSAERPADPPSRNVTFSKKEIELLVHTLGYETDKELKTQTARVGAAFLFAIETGARSGEILNLTWSDIKNNVATIKEGKTLAARRQVPLSKAAIAILKRLPKDGKTCFELTDQNRDALFRKAMTSAGIKNHHFHDTRATAITNLAKKLDVLALAKMVGIKDLQILNVYYRETPEQIAKRLG